MVFRTAGALAAVLSNFSGQALAQYYPPPQASPPPPVSPTVTADELSPLNAPVVLGDSLPPVGVGPAYQRMPGGRYSSVPCTHRCQADQSPSAVGAGASFCPISVAIKPLPSSVC